MIKVSKILNSTTVVRVKYKRSYTGIFKIRCFATRKSFIGGGTDCDKRLREHVTNLQRGKHRVKELQADYDKYGANRFEFKVIQRVKNKELKEISEAHRGRFLNNLLLRWIKYYEVTDKSKGYNARVYKKRSVKVTTSLD